MLWKYGGWFLDWGTLVLKSLENFKNAIAFENDKKLHCKISKIHSIAINSNISKGGEREREREKEKEKEKREVEEIIYWNFIFQVES
jgi:hypothetical protein